ncbi:uncharacterized protein FOMMEDRAFT_84858 [Fomitiporia mediterranea MF3/22]|uniref:uncharacterized protein n=1 Tax=Fomitiporia mediterranea (strain MF3/22) TaxID=694068 RepID=UPI0004407AE9|nr:uncharacterized protein FOMMEDRAFT_84858 [Fomitiporia mediterranea MF3/22]EJD02978.1 hypothetical protein FOMMEDRAFT_84858 [Fomitiporia mediterranea MF3/22]
MGTKNGTSLLLNSAIACTNSRGHTTNATQPPIIYSEAAHRTLIALRCAKSNRPFNFVKDCYYALEVAMLRPGVSLPSPDTVSSDIKAIYTGLSIQVRNYFKVSTNILFSFYI